MNSFVRAVPVKDPEKRDRVINDMMVQGKLTRAQAVAFYDEELAQERWMNDTYTVVIRRNVPAQASGFPAVHWLSIRRNDRQPVRDWRHLQRIKNELVGPYHEGFELFPSESRKVDGANQYHMFVFAEQFVQMPVGFTERMVTDIPFEGAVQRPLEEE